MNLSESLLLLLDYEKNHNPIEILNRPIFSKETNKYDIIDVTDEVRKVKHLII